MSSMFCSDCHGINFIEDRSDGSTVCTGCGLVVSPFMLVNDNQNSNFDQVTKDVELVEALYKLQIESDDMEYIVSEYYYELKKLHPNKSQSVLRSISLSHKTGISLDKAADMFQIHRKNIKHICDETQKEKEISERVAYLVSCFESDRFMKMKIIREIIALNIKLLPYIQTKKPSKMDPILFYYVYTNSFNKTLNPLELCRVSNISIVTFNNHMKLLCRYIS
jgi:transcription initiation factor TFIIIB Brf1 subunit/transcription initiation factor TFIIB